MTTEPKHTYRIDEMSETDAYKVGSGLTVPRPIGWIGTVGIDGVRNLAPYSFFNMVSGYPPTFVVAPALTVRKDTLANLEQTREFTINVVTEETVEAMNLSAGSYPADVDEFEFCGLTAVPSETIAAPMVGEATANFECVVTQIIPVGMPSDDLPGASMLVIGEAQRVHVAERVIDDAFHVDQEELRAIGRHVGGQYSRTAGTLFNLDRPE
jgi:flavin reductase (DIM6/NTAB) family NADH-FMN oxidoreductase RutF